MTQVKVSPRDLAPVILGTAALLSPHVLLALGLAFAAGGIRLVTRDVTRLERAALAVGLAGLGIATWLMATIIGPLPATYSALGDGPIGDPAARMLMLLLSVPVTVFLFDWRLNPAAAALLGRVGAELLPAGVTLWQGIAMPLALVLAFVAMRRRRPDLLAVAVGAFGLWSGSLLGRIGGGAALAARMLGQGDLARVLGAAGFLVVLAGAWRIQFVYTVVLALLVLFSTIFESFRSLRSTAAAPSGPQE
jgi:hypothetical protein